MSIFVGQGMTISWYIQIFNSIYLIKFLRYGQKSLCVVVGLPVASILLGYLVDGLVDKTWHLVVLVANCMMVELMGTPYNLGV